MEIKNETNKAIYLLLLASLRSDFVKKINKAPIVCNKINEDKIGKFINSILIKLIKLKNQQALQMHIGKYNHFEILQLY